VSIETGREIFECTIDDLKRWSGVPVATPVTVESVSDWQRASVPTLHSKPRVLILHANGTNRDHDAALACTVAGGEPEIVHVNQLAHGMRRLSDYDMIVVPGGFSYGDDLGAGVLWAQDLRLRFGAELQDFVDSGRPVLGICNGFQALVKAGLLPDADVNIAPEQRTSTLTFNAHRQFECRWVVLEPQEDSVCLFTRGLVDPILAPVAHGEGRFLTAASATVDALRAAGMIALRYSADNYPHNPNGSAARIAGICNRAGNVLGLMPHPENHIFDWQHPGFGGDRFRRGGGLALFTNALRYIASRA
jgi:phosphoribosylformylglycinamidine synthase